LPELNLIATCGAYLMLVGVILFGINVLVSALRGKPAGDDPWGANSLEWATTSPPPEYNFTSLPPIRSERPVWDMHHPEGARASR
jgi:heme/copper-type cytochrome/quinol oxidase subunit 1